jgi:isopentenyldiphosphate isomerase
MLHIVHPETGDLIGEAVPRAMAIARGAWCRSTNVFVFNGKGQVLCHRRSSNKERLPGVWMTHLGGHVSVGETFETNALKELEEEAGIISHPSRLLSWRTTKIADARLWVREFVTLMDVDADGLVPQLGEVDEFRWMHVEEILGHAEKEPERWCVGTHDFRMEYYCMRAALNVADGAGAIVVPKGLHVWQPGLAA